MGNCLKFSNNLHCSQDGKDPQPWRMFAKRCEEESAAGGFLKRIAWAYIVFDPEQRQWMTNRGLAADTGVLRKK